MELAAALHHSRGVGPEVLYQAPRGQKLASSVVATELCSVYAEEVVGTLPDWLSAAPPRAQSNAFPGAVIAPQLAEQLVEAP